jgi:hypothetical protein
MARHGHGRIQRQVRRAFIAHPDRQFTTAELAAWCYPHMTAAPQRKHRWAIVRAAQAMAVRVGRRWPGGVIFKARDE